MFVMLNYLRNSKPRFCIDFTMHSACVRSLCVLMLFRGLGGGQKALDPDTYIPFRLVKREVLSHDTRMFRFALQTPGHILGLPIGQHVSMKYVDEQGKTVTRSYTPTSSDIDVRP